MIMITKKTNSMSKDEFTRMFLAVQSVTGVAKANGRSIKTSDDYEEYIELVGEMEDFEVDELLKSLEKKKVTKAGENTEKVSKSKGKSEKSFKHLEVVSTKEDVKSSSKKVKDIKESTVNTTKEESKVVDRTSKTEESEVKTLKVDLNNVVNLEVKENKDIKEMKVAKDIAEKENEESLNKQMDSREKIEAVIEEEKEFFSGKKKDVFEVKITYSSAKSEFNGMKLSENEIKGGNKQIGFYVNDGEFADTPVKNVRRKRAKKTKDECSNSAVQISFV